MNFEDPHFSKDSKLKGGGEVLMKKYHPRRPMYLQDPYFLLRSQGLKGVCEISKRCSRRRNILEDQWIGKTTLLLRNGNLKGGILETLKTEGEIFTKNVTDGLGYWKP